MTTTSTPTEISQRRWLPSLRELSDEQRQIINASFEGRAFVYGPAGAGKTALITWRAKNLKGKKFLIFAFTNELINFIHAAANELDIPQDRIKSFYSWAWGQYKTWIGTPPQNAYDRWVDELIDCFQAHPERTPRYDYLLIDEAQDFKPNVIRLIHMLSKNIFVLGDGAQCLYEGAADVQQIVEAWAPIEQRANLTKNYRNPKTIARVAAHFLTDPALTPERFLQMVPGHRSEMKPIWYQVETPEQQADQIATIIEQARGQQRIGLLFAEHEQIIRLEQLLQSRGVEYRVAENKRGVGSYNSTVPVLMTAYSAKGLEFDWVILADLNRGAWDKQALQAKMRRLFFVAVTRAKSRLYLISRRGLECRYLREIPVDLLQIPQTASSALPPASPRPHAPATDVSDDDLPF